MAKSLGSEARPPGLKSELCDWPAVTPGSRLPSELWFPSFWGFITTPIPKGCEGEMRRYTPRVWVTVPLLLTVAHPFHRQENKGGLEQGEPGTKM